MSSRVIKTSKQPFFRSLSFTDLFVELMQWSRIRRGARIFPEVQTISQIPLRFPAVQVLFYCLWNDVSKLQPYRVKNAGLILGEVTRLKTNSLETRVRVEDLANFKLHLEARRYPTSYKLKRNWKVKGHFCLTLKKKKMTIYHQDTTQLEDWSLIENQRLLKVTQL